MLPLDFLIGLSHPDGSQLSSARLSPSVVSLVRGPSWLRYLLSLSKLSGLVQVTPCQCFARKSFHLKKKKVFCTVVVAQHTILYCCILKMSGSCFLWLRGELHNNMDNTPTDLSTCHSRRSAGVINNINNNCILFRPAV